MNKINDDPRIHRVLLEPECREFGHDLVRGTRVTQSPEPVGRVGGDEHVAELIAAIVERAVGVDR